MRIDLTVCGPDGADRDVAVLAQAAVPFGAVRPALDPAGVAQPWCSGGRPLTDGQHLGGPGLRSGARLSVAPQTAEPAVRRIHVVGGIDAGLPLLGTRRTVVIGRGPGCDLRLRDPDVSRRHAQLTFTASGVVVRDLGSTHGTTLGTVPVSRATAWEPAQWLRVGDTHLAQGSPGSGATPVSPDGHGSLVVRPRPRPKPTEPPVIELPPERATTLRTATGWSAILVPSLAGIGLALWAGSVAFLAIALLSPFALFGLVAGERIAHRRRDNRARRDHAASAARTAERVTAALRDETAVRRQAHPDAASLLAIARGPSDRLWERGRGDPDLLEVRLGTSDAPAQARINRSGRGEPAGTVTAVPAVVDLADGPLGIVGPLRTVRALARWLLAQLATLASPADIRIEVRTNDDAQWQWARWLPHVRPTARVAPTVVVLQDAGVAVSPAAPAICLAESATELPAECRRIVAVANESGTRLRVDGHIVLTDAVDDVWAEQLARSLAPYVPATDGRPSIPESCRLGDLLGPADPATVAHRWATASRGATAAIGAGADGPVVLDLDRDGPHLLIAGTTGSGKSELLRTLVIALACAHPPDDVAFVLIDFKGGSAFAECVALPHVAGLVTDLDEHLTARALASLGAELRRRERHFAAARVSDLAGYRAAGATPPLPRLVIVVDEFATLANELPDFVAGLTAVAQRGRSLGLHLVLATQRPAGTVTAEVRANCAIRVALRVTDAADSRDVVETADAAAIPHDLPGRAYLWTDGSTRPVQVARTDLPARSPGGVEVRPLGPWRSLEPAPARVGTRTDLADYVRAVRDAAAGRTPGAPPWLPPLPDRLPLDALPVRSGPQVPIGLVDLPDRQTQQPLCLDLAAGSSVLVAGASRTGRTAALLAIAVAAARQHSPDALHVHAIDLAGDLVERLAGLPHRGTLAGAPAGMEVIDALLGELTCSADPTRTVLLVDGWDAFTRASDEWDGGRSVERLLALVRAGRPGRTIVVAGDRSTLTPRLAGVMTTRLLLRLPDRTDHALAGTALAAVPSVMPPGRVLIAPDGIEAQLGYVTREDVAALPPGSSTALRLRPLLPRVELCDLPPPGAAAPFAVAAPRGRPVGLPLTAGCRLLVTGPARSGRSTALGTLLQQVVRAGVPVGVVAGARSPLRAAAADLGVPALDPDEDPTAAGELDRVLLVDDAEDLADTALDDVLARYARQDCRRALVVAARVEDAARAYRGLIAEVRRCRCALLLQPGASDGDLVGVRLHPGWAGGPPGRGVLVGDAGWGEQFGAGPLRVQVAA